MDSRKNKSTKNMNNFLKVLSFILLRYYQMERNQLQAKIDAIKNYLDDLQKRIKTT
jgi:hypothetical protein